MNTKNTNLKKFIANPVRTINIITVIAALLLVISLFMPAVKVLGESLTFQEIEEIDDTDGLFATLLIIFGISIIWAVIPKIWAAIVGALYGILPVFLIVGQTLDWQSNDYMSPQIGSILMCFLSIIVLVLSIVKLVIIIRNKKNAKKAPASTVMPQPPFIAQ